MALVIRRSRIHADGVYTTTPIKRRAIVAEYTGPRLTNAGADAIYEHSPRTYLFGLIDGEHVIDGDGIAAFINHACGPNCEADEVKGRVIKVRPVFTRSERLKKAVDRAYAEKYNTPGSLIFVKGFRLKKRRDTTTELVPL